MSSSRLIAIFLVASSASVLAIAAPGKLSPARFENRSEVPVSFDIKFELIRTMSGGQKSTETEVIRTVPGFEAKSISPTQRGGDDVRRSTYKILAVNGNTITLQLSIQEGDFRSPHHPRITREISTVLSLKTGETKVVKSYTAKIAPESSAESIAFITVTPEG